jgi:hypothetical protein
MWRRRRRANQHSNGGPESQAQRPGLEHDPSAGPSELLAEIARLTEINRASRDRATERRLLQLRHRAAIGLVDADGAEPVYPEPDLDRLPESEGLPEVAAADLTPELLRAGIIRDGCVLVRGLVDRATALGFAAQIERAFAERNRISEGVAPAEGYYEEFQPDARFAADVPRPWVQVGGGLLGGDSPLLAFEMFELFEAAGLPSLINGYLGEPGLISLQKTTLRKAEPAVGGTWHQDGAFMGDVRSVNLWLSLSRCGDEAPGLDVVPRRLEQVVTVGGGADVGFEFGVTQEKAAELAGEKAIIRPIFEPGDALFFDHLFLHQTASDPAMPKVRFAIENWFFGASAFPADYAPLAV